MASISWAQGSPWTQKADMPTARAFLSTSVVSGIIYAIGGWDGEPGRGSFATVEAYDPVRDTWTTKADMPSVSGAVPVTEGLNSTLGWY